MSSASVIFGALKLHIIASLCANRAVDASVSKGFSERDEIKFGRLIEGDLLYIRAKIGEL